MAAGNAAFLCSRMVAFMTITFCTGVLISP